MNPKLERLLATIESFRPTIYFREAAFQSDALREMGYTVDGRGFQDPIPTAAVEELPEICGLCSGTGGVRAGGPQATWVGVRQSGIPCDACHGLGRALKQGRGS